MSRFAALASPASSRSSSVEREEDVGKELEEEKVEEELMQPKSKSEEHPEEKVVEKDSDKISLHLGKDKWSSIHRINGYAWRLHVYYKDNKYFVEVHCEKSTEAELWRCTATIELTSPYYKTMDVEFNSWDTSSYLIASSGDAQWIKMENERNRKMGSGYYPDRLPYVVKITPKEDGNRWTRRQALNLSEPHDGVIKIGNELKEIQVHREFLATHSPLFMKEFFENYKETEITEISISDVDFALFAKTIRILYDVHTASPQNFQDINTADVDVRKMLSLVQRFQIKIVEDRCISFLLSNECPIPLHERLVMSEQKKLSVLTENLLEQYTKTDIVSLSNSGMFDQITPESLKFLFNKSSVDAFGNMDIRPVDPIEEIFSFARERNNGKMIILSIRNTDYQDPETLEYWNELEQLNRTTESPVMRINGFPWYLRVERRVERSDRRNRYGSLLYLEHINVYLICDKTKEAELWKSAATIKLKAEGDEINYNTSSLLFSCWESSHRIFTTTHDYSRYTKQTFAVEVIITAVEDGNSYVRRPTLDPLEEKDGILVFENEKKKIEVNKQSLADYSPYFDRLFFGSYMEKTMAEIPIGGIKYKEFYNIMELLYGSDKAHFHCKNAQRMLQLADRLFLEILKDRAVALLLSPSSSVIPMPKKLLIADQYFLPFLMDGLISQLKSVEQLRELSESEEWLDFKPDTHRLLFQKFCI